MSDLEVRFCTRPDGVRLAYAAIGRGPPLVLVHGWITHLEVNWDDPGFRRFIEALAARFRVVTYDKHGCGLSDRGRNEFSLESELEDLRAVVTHLDLGPHVVLAYSQAGPVAIAYAVQEQGAVSELVLIGSWASGPSVAPPEVQRSILGLIGANWSLGTGVLADIFQVEMEGEARARVLRFQREAASADVAQGLLRLSYQIDVAGLLEQVRVPTLVVHRKDDRAAHVSLGRDLAAGIPGARFVALDGSAHVPWWGDEPSMIGAVQQFLGHDVDEAFEPPTVPEGAAALRLAGDFWLVAYRGEQVTIKDVKGLRYLRTLLADPGREFHALDLVHAVEGSSPSTGRNPSSELGARLGHDGDLGPMLDQQARSAYQQRLGELRDDIDDAEAAHDIERAARARAELDSLTEEMAAAFGLGGRPRSSGSTVERARVKVTRLLRDAVRRIGDQLPELGHLLDASVRTGTYSAYEPVPGSPQWRLDRSPEPNIVPPDVTPLQ